MGEPLRISYDEEADVLYVSLGHPEYTRYLEVNDDFVLRLDPETKEVVGFTIIDFAAHFADSARLPFDIPLTAVFTPVPPIKDK